jgi:hypothetical protein
MALEMTEAHAKGFRRFAPGEKKAVRHQAARLLCLDLRKC